VRIFRDGFVLEAARDCVQGMDKMGDHGFMMVNENGFPQLQSLEGWQIGAIESPCVPYNYAVNDGVVLDAKGVVAGYVVQDLSGTQIVNAGQMKLVYDPDNYHKYRGYSPMRRGRMTYGPVGLKGFEKKGAKIHSALAAIIEGGMVVEDDWATTVGTQTSRGSVGADGTNPDGTQATKHDKRLHCGFDGWRNSDF